MAVIKPFCAIRPNQEKAAKIAALPYDVYNRTEAKEIVAANPQSVEDYKGGKKKAIGFLVGQTMKAMKGKADPGAVNKILQEVLEK